MFSSALSSEMESFLELRKKTVSKSVFKDTQHVISNFDKFLCNNNYTDKALTEPIVSSFISTFTGSGKTIHDKVGDLRVFIRYLNSRGSCSFMPDATRAKSDYIPYIFTDKDVEQIIDIADSLQGHKGYKYQIFMPTIIRIMYGCGMRIGEVVSLKRGDLDFKNNTIFIRHAKNYKQRLIPMHESLSRILERYCLAIGILDNENAYLFPGKAEGTHFCIRCADWWFAKILSIAGIAQVEDKSGCPTARLHCFRHLFVMKSMLQLEKNGHPVDMNDLLLPTYLGHECMLDTEKYMRFSGVQVPDSLDSFESYTDSIIPDVEVPDEE